MHSLIRHRASFVLGLICALAATVSSGRSETESTVPRHSFLDPVGDFARDSILKPAAPFELVPARDPNAWSFVFEPYAWSIGLDGRIGIKGLPPTSFSSSSLSVLKHLDWGFFARGEIRKGRWGALADGYYAALSTSGSLENRIYESANIGVQQSIASLALAYRVIDDPRGYLDVYAGVRYNFLGSQIEAGLDDSRINDIGESITSAISRRIDNAVSSAVSKLTAGALNAAANVSVESLVPPLAEGGERNLRARLLRDRDLRDLIRAGIIKGDLSRGRVKGALENYIRAKSGAALAAAAGRSNGALLAAADRAKVRLSREISNSIKDSVPTYGSADEWWFDPIIGLRGQINLTRWLFIAAQGDVGGFGAGSQIAWNAQATIGFNITRNLFAEFGYRYMYVDYQNGGFLYDMNSFGLYSGVGVRF